MKLGPKQRIILLVRIILWLSCCELEEFHESWQQRLKPNLKSVLSQNSLWQGLLLLFPFVFEACSHFQNFIQVDNIDNNQLFEFACCFFFGRRISHTSEHFSSSEEKCQMNNSYAFVCPDVEWHIRRTTTQTNHVHACEWQLDVFSDMCACAGRKTKLKTNKMDEPVLFKGRGTKISNYEAGGFWFILLSSTLIMVEVTKINPSISFSNYLPSDPFLLTPFGHFFTRKTPDTLTNHFVIRLAKPAILCCAEPREKKI